MNIDEIWNMAVLVIVTKLDGEREHRKVREEQDGSA